MVSVNLMWQVLSMLLSGNPDCNPQCRACHYKDLTYSEQLARKQAWADKQLAPWHTLLRPLIAAPEEERLGYRSKSWLRAHVIDGRVSFGMTRAVQVAGKWEEEFISWDRCPLHIPGITELLAKLAPALEQVAPTFLEQSLVGVWLGSPHVVLISRDGVFEGVDAIDWSQVIAAPFTQVWTHHNPQVGRRIFSHHPIASVWSASSEGETAVHPIRAFRQVAQTLLRDARARAVRALLSSSPSQVVDLYCGTGDLALLLPPSVAWLGIELSSEAVNHANALQTQRGASHRAFVGTVEHRLADPAVRAEIQKSYVLYINPPRTGMLPEARERLVEIFKATSPHSIAYLSCSASSLARDLEFFERAGFRVESLQSYDFFPQTEHFETLAILRR